jgi:hypothetical protein
MVGGDGTGARRPRRRAAPHGNYICFLLLLRGYKTLLMSGPVVASAADASGVVRSANAQAVTRILSLPQPQDDRCADA